MLYLVGLPGSGKSTVGRLLARRLELDFADSDHLIEERIGCPIRDFFESQGEPAFRDAEEAVIADLANSFNGVLATGGGAVLREANRSRLRAAGRGVYLQSTPDELFRRLRHDKNRPLLQVDDPLQRLRVLHAERDPLYRKTAHDTVDASRPSVPALVRAIMAVIER
jgi:shikimate kinase